MIGHFWFVIPECFYRESSVVFATELIKGLNGTGFPIEPTPNPSLTGGEPFGNDSPLVMFLKHRRFFVNAEYFRKRIAHFTERYVRIGAIDKARHKIRPRLPCYPQCGQRFIDLFLIARCADFGKAFALLYFNFR